MNPLTLIVALLLAIFTIARCDVERTTPTIEPPKAARWFGLGSGA